MARGNGLLRGLLPWIAVCASAVALAWLEAAHGQDILSWFAAWWRTERARLEPPGTTWHDALIPTIFLIGVILLIRNVFRGKGLWGRSIASFILLFLAGRYLLWRVVGTLNFDDRIALALGLLLLGAELLRLVEFSTSLGQSAIWPFLYRDRSRQADELSSAILREEYLPSVDVYIPTFNEPVEMLRRTIIGCQAMTYPNKRVCVLDDGDRPAMRALAEELGCTYFSRSHGDFGKAGNINNALAQTSGEIVCSFDSDFVPTTNFLTRTVGFFQDADVALVQTPKHFNNQEAIRYNLGVESQMTCEEDVFYRAILPARDVTNSFICHGSGYLVRRKVYLEIGGAPTECIIDDLYGSMKIHAAGYKTVYLNEALSAGDAPDSIHAFLDQRMRWAHACIQALYKPTVNPFVLKGLSVMQRLHYTATIFYWFSIPGRLVFLLMPLVYVLSPHEVMRTTLESILYYWLPYFVAEVTMRNWINFGKRSRYWSEVYDILMCVPMTVVIIQTLINPFGPWSRVTPKGNANQKLSVNWLITGPLLALLGLCILGLVLPLLEGYMTIITPETEGILMFWSCYNLVILSVAVQASIDVPQARRFLRFTHALEYRIETSGAIITGKTVDMGEGGALLHASDELLNLPHATECQFSIPEIGLFKVPVQISHKPADRGKLQSSVVFGEMTVPQQRSLIEFLFCQPGQWQELSISEARSFCAYIFSALRLYPLAESRKAAKPKAAA